MSRTDQPNRGQGIEAEDDMRGKGRGKRAMPAMPRGIQKRADAGLALPDGKPFEGGIFSPPGLVKTPPVAAPPQGVVNNSFLGGFSPPGHSPLNYEPVTPPPAMPSLPSQARGNLYDMPSLPPVRRLRGRR